MQWEPYKQTDTMKLTFTYRNFAYVLIVFSGDLGKVVSELVTVMTDEEWNSESASPSDEELHPSARFNPK